MINFCLGVKVSVSKLFFDLIESIVTPYFAAIVFKYSPATTVCISVVVGREAGVVAVGVPTVAVVVCKVLLSFIPNLFTIDGDAVNLIEELRFANKVSNCDLVFIFREDILSNIACRFCCLVELASAVETAKSTSSCSLGFLHSPEYIKVSRPS